MNRESYSHKYCKNILPFQFKGRFCLFSAADIDIKGQFHLNHLCLRVTKEQWCVRNCHSFLYESSLHINLMKKYKRKKEIQRNVNSLTTISLPTHMGAKQVADLRIILIEGKFQERLTGYREYISNLFVFEANTSQQTWVKQTKTTGNSILQHTRALMRIPSATKCPDQVFMYIDQTPGLC